MTAYAEVIGDPIAHSKSPLIHNFWLSKLGIDADYRACHVRPDELADYFEQRAKDPAWRGCNVTIPHKVAALRHVFHVDPIVERIGALNTVRKSGWEIIGFNTDTNGVCQALYEGGDINGAAEVCLIGTGGAARAAMSEFGAFGVKHVKILCRSKGRGEQLLKDFDQQGSVLSFAEAAAALADVECLVNASSLGMAGQAPMPDVVLDGVARMRSTAFVFDMVYTPLDTMLLQRARACQIVAVDGLVMLLHQAAQAFYEIFKPDRLPNARDPELRALLTA